MSKLYYVFINICKIGSAPMAAPLPGGAPMAAPLPGGAPMAAPLPGMLFYFYFILLFINMNGFDNHYE